MRMMAVDYGDVRTGVAFCDVREMLATAYDTVEERYAPKLAEKLPRQRKQSRSLWGCPGIWTAAMATGATPAAAWAICYRSLPDFRWCTRTSA